MMSDPFILTSFPRTTTPPMFSGNHDDASSIFRQNSMCPFVARQIFHCSAHSVHDMFLLFYIMCSWNFHTFPRSQRKLCVAKQTVTIIVVSFSLLFSGDRCLDLLLPHHLRNHRTRRFVMPTSSEILAGSSAPSGTNMERLCRSCTPRRIPCYLKTSPRPVLQRHRPRQIRFHIDGPPVKAVPESFRKRPTPPSSPVPECM